MRPRFSSQTSLYLRLEDSPGKSRARETGPGVAWRKRKKKNAPRGERQTETDKNKLYNDNIIIPALTPLHKAQQRFYLLSRHLSSAGGGGLTRFLMKVKG
jgi:hypothetical protein